MVLIEKEWITDAGLQARCVIVNGAHRCGSVGLPAGHPLYGLDYYAAHEARPDLCVHGGLTFSDRFNGSPLWWFGFDCLHSGDGSLDGRFAGEARSLEYVESECESLAAQFLAPMEAEEAPRAS